MSNQANIRWAGEELEPEILLDAQVPERAEPLEDHDLVAERFGNYLIVGELAMGGMAELFLAVQRGLEGFVKVVVIKRVLPQYAESDEFVRMFIEEARLAARLDHRNIVRTYEFGEVHGQYFTVMEYLPGEDLCSVLNRLLVSQQHLPFNMAATLVSQVCSGLHFAHELTDVTGNPLSLVHRDINPANIVVTYSGEVKIIDFGVAKIATGAKTVTGTIKGKLAYMSPEQLLVRGVDRRSDVFSAGVVLWELLVGRPLFIRDSEAATIYAIMNDPIHPISRYRPDVPPELEAIVTRALSRTPADRFDSAEEMQIALDRFLEGQEKCDARSRSRMLEALFGSTRAEAKRAIAQTRALTRNVSLVMKLRSEVRADLAERVDALALGTEPQHRSHPVAPERESTSRTLTIALAMLIVTAIAGGLAFVLTATSDSRADAQTTSSAAGRATIQIDSTPAGAAISIGGEPTGLKTPATLAGVTSSTLTVRLDLAGHESRTVDIAVPPGESGIVTKHVTLEGQPTRLVIDELPVGATVMVDGASHPAGKPITVASGTHEVAILVGGRTVAQETLKLTAGDQSYRFDGTTLRPR